MRAVIEARDRHAASADTRWDESSPAARVALTMTIYVECISLLRRLGDVERPVEVRLSGSGALNGRVLVHMLVVRC